MQKKLCVISVISEEMPYSEYQRRKNVRENKYMLDEPGHMVIFSDTHVEWFPQSEFESKFKDTYSDLDNGRHSFQELYMWIYALFGLLAKYSNKPAYKSERNYDDSPLPGVFQAGIEINKRMVVFHLPIKYLDRFPAREVINAPLNTGETDFDYLDTMFADWKLSEDDKARLSNIRPVLYYGQSNR